MVALMKSLCFSFIVLASIATLFSVADARRFYAGGNGNWVVNPHESYKSWAESNRFQVNDTIYFKYAKGSDSVQLVSKADYDGCNVKNPIEKFENGETEVALNRSGHYYFISGNQEHCVKGQKLIIAVLSIRNHPDVPISPAKAPSTAHPPKSPVAPAKAPSTAQPPKSHSPVSPVAPAKAPSTAHSPAKPPSMSQPPKAQPPKSSVSPVVSPSKAPTKPPATHTPPSKSPSPTNSPRSSPSPKSPSPAAPPTPSAKPPTSSPTPSASTPTADNNMAPAPSPKSAATVVTVTSVMSTLFSVTLTVLMFA